MLNIATENSDHRRDSDVSNLTPDTETTISVMNPRPPSPESELESRPTNQGPMPIPMIFSTKSRIAAATARMRTLTNRWVMPNAGPRYIDARNVANANMVNVK